MIHTCIYTCRMYITYRYGISCHEVDLVQKPDATLLAQKVQSNHSADRGSLFPPSSRIIHIFVFCDKVCCNVFPMSQCCLSGLVMRDIC